LSIATVFGVIDERRIYRTASMNLKNFAQRTNVVIHPLFCSQVT